MDDQPQPQPPIATIAPEPIATQPATLQPQPIPVPIEKEGLKTAGAIITIVFGAYTIISGLLQFIIFPIAGLIVLALGVFWLITGVLILKSSVPTKSAKLLQRAGAGIVAYFGILMLINLILPVSQTRGMLVPLVLVVALAIIATKYGKHIKNQ